LSLTCSFFHSRWRRQILPFALGFAVLGVLISNFLFFQDLSRQTLVLSRENEALRADLKQARQALDPDEVTVTLLILYALLSLLLWTGRMWWFRHKPGAVYPPDR